MTVVTKVTGVLFPEVLGSQNNHDFRRHSKGDKGFGELFKKECKRLDEGGVPAAYENLCKGCQYYKYKEDECIIMDYLRIKCPKLYG